MNRTIGYHCLTLLFAWISLQGCSKQVQYRTKRNLDTHQEHRAPKRMMTRSPSDDAVTSTRRPSSVQPAPPPSVSKPSSSPRMGSTAGRAYRPNTPRRRAYRRYIRRRRFRRETRPGLGTAYGESLYAPVQQVSFVRRSSRPNSMLQLHYNSPRGVHAMARYLRGVRCCGRLSTIAGSGVSARLTDANGRSLRGLRSGGRIWVMGQHGHRYRIRIHNHTSRRMEIVVSVDGLDVIDGKRASLRKRGYILMPHRTLWVDGFRRSYSHVAAFRFSKVSNSYAGRTSGSRNVGVVGVAVFPEEYRRHNPYELQRRFSASPFTY